MTRPWRGRLAARVAGMLGLAVGLAFVLPAAAAAHTLNPTYASRLPLAVYVVGAATTVALSFASSSSATSGRRRRTSSRRGPCRRPGCASACGRSACFGWVWIIAQGIAGGSSDGTSSTLFLWVYGWVGLAIICAIIGPGLALPRSVLDAPRPRAAALLRGCTSRAGRSPTIPSASGAGRPTSASRSSSGSSWSSWPARRRCSSCSSATRRSRSR